MLLLAIDFDGGTWEQDAQAFSKRVASSNCLSLLKGHVPGKAVTFGCSSRKPSPPALRETWDPIYSPKLWSDDRRLDFAPTISFSNQDTMPKGGFSNT